MLTTDRNDPLLKENEASGMQRAYLVLSEDERNKGFIVPYSDKYIHLACGSVTTVAKQIAETYARNPKFYGGTFCCHCGHHYALTTNGKWQFEWSDGRPVGSNTEEANIYLANKAALVAQRCAATRNNVDVPLHLQSHIDQWLLSNELSAEKVQWASFPVGMVQSFIDRVK